MTQPVGVNFDQAVRDAVMQIMSDPIAFPEVFKSWVTGWVEANPPTLPISQIIGFDGFTASASNTTASQTISSTSYTDLTPSGPTLSGLAAGHYVVWFGCTCKASVDGNSALMSVSINGVAASDNDALSNSNQQNVTCTNVLVEKLTNKSNTLQAKFRVSAGTGDFSRPFLIALKYANL